MAVEFIPIDRDTPYIFVGQCPPIDLTRWFGALRPSHLIVPSLRVCFNAAALPAQPPAASLDDPASIFLGLPVFDEVA